MDADPTQPQGGEALPEGVEADHPLKGISTIRTGGPADFFSRPAEMTSLQALLAWAATGKIAIAVVGSGSNLLISDEGFRGLVIKLDGELAGIERDGDRVTCGGGMRLPSASAKAANWGLSGLEFGVNIPGTVGGAVRMNANAYGGQLAGVLEWVEICTAAGVSTRTPDQLGLRYRHSNLVDGEIVARVRFSLTAGDSPEIKETLAGMRARRLAAQPSGIKTFGSTFKNPDDPRAEGQTAGLLLDAAGCRGLTRGGARISEKHANFVENMGEASTADVLEVMAEARRKVHERTGVVLEPEVLLLGNVSRPDAWDLGTGQPGGA